MADELFDSAPLYAEGIVDEVTLDVEVPMVYPCVVLPSNLELSKGVWKVLARLMTAESTDKSVAVYMNSDDEELQFLGELLPSGLVSLVRLVGGTANLTGYLCKDKPLPPHLIMALT